MCNAAIYTNLSAVANWEFDMNELRASNKSEAEAPIVTNTNNYIRTPEDNENDRKEREWKEKNNRKAYDAFMRLHPTGRAVPRCE